MPEPARHSMPEVVYLGYVGSQGGDTLQMLELAAGVAAAGRRVQVVVPDVANVRPLAARYAERGVPIVLEPRLRLGSRAQNPLDVARVLRRWRAPVLHLHTGDIAMPRVMLLAMDLLRWPRAFATIHHPYAEDMTVGSPRARYWAAAAARRFHTVICPSRHGADAQIAYGLPAERVRVIHNGIDIARFGGGDRGVPRKQLGLDDDALLVAFTSRLHKQKRPLDVVDAFAWVAREFPQAHLVFVGDGPMSEEVRARAAQTEFGARIHFAGRQHNVPDWLAAADVWFLPTEAENFSLAVLEALAAACPILSTWCRGNDEVLVPEENALTTSVGDVDAMVAGLRRLLAEPDLRTRLGAAARETARGFTRERMVAAHLACYNEAISLSSS